MRNLKHSKSFRSSILLLLLVPLVACSSAPPRDFNVTLSLIDWDAGCIVYENDDGDEVQLCIADGNMPEDIIAITAEDYKKERDYQDKLKDACRNW